MLAAIQLRTGPRISLLNGEAPVSLEASNQPVGNDHHKQFSNLWGHYALNIVTVWMDYM